MRKWAVLIFLACAAPATAQQVASMSPDAAYVRSVSYTQSQFSKLSGDQEMIRAQLAAALAELKRLKARADVQDQGAQLVLAAFGAGDGKTGVDVLMAQAAAKAKASAEDYKAAGALAFAVDTNRSAAAYEQALKLAPDDADTLQRLAWLYLRLGQLDKVTSAADRLVTDSNPLMQTYGYMRRGDVASTRGDLAAGEAAYNAGLAIALKAGLKDRQAAALNNLGVIAGTRGDLVAAEDYTKRALALSTELGNKEGQASALGNLGIIARIRGGLAAAEDYTKRALALDTELGSKEGQVNALGNLGIIAQTRSDLPAAEAYQKRALALNTELGNKKGQAIILANLGNIAHLRGKSEEACELYRRSLALYEGIGAGGSQDAGIARNIVASYCSR